MEESFVDFEFSNIIITFVALNNIFTIIVTYVELIISELISNLFIFIK